MPLFLAYVSLHLPLYTLRREGCDAYSASQARTREWFEFSDAVVSDGMGISRCGI